jgi:hypothetical protein
MSDVTQILNAIEQGDAQAASLAGLSVEEAADALGLSRANGTAASGMDYQAPSATT